MMFACEFSAIDFDDVIAGAGVLAMLPIDLDDVIVSAVDFGVKTLRGSGVGEGVGEGVVVGAWLNTARSPSLLARLTPS